MNRTNLLVGGVIVAVILSLVAISKPGQTIIKEVQSNIGAIPGNSVDGPEFIQSGHSTWKARGLLTATTTTVGVVGSIKSPPATSTMMYGACALTTGTTTASVMTLAKAATALATTTVLNKQILNANDTLTLIASTTNASLTTTGAMIYAPNTFFNCSIQGGTGGYDGIKGSINAVFEVN